MTSILGMGNPLLDISATVEQSVLDEWGATLNNAILAEEKHQPLYAKLASTHPVEYIAGGATLNSIRVAQWMLANDGKKDASHYIGSIGQDEFGATLKKQLAADGVKGHFLEIAEKATGTCAVLVKDNERSTHRQPERRREVRQGHALRHARGAGRRRGRGHLLHGGLPADARGRPRDGE